MAAEKFDVYSHVTNQIIAQIKAGTPPWRKPWTGGGVPVSLPERFNGEAYRGINILMLWATAMARDYSSARWMTFNQARQLGGHVRKVEKSATVVKYGTVEREDESGEVMRCHGSSTLWHRTNHRQIVKRLSFRLIASAWLIFVLLQQLTADAEASARCRSVSVQQW